MTTKLRRRNLGRKVQSQGQVPVDKLTDGAGRSFTLGEPVHGVSSSCGLDNALVALCPAPQRMERSSRLTGVRGITGA